MNTILKLEHIQKYYGNEGNITKAIKDISFSVEAGEFLGIMGASGSGKTTLLNCISTIDTVSAGHIFLEGTDITEIKPKFLARFRRENLGFVFQFVLVKRIGACLFRYRDQVASGRVPVSSQMGELAEPETFFPILEEF